MESTSSVLEKSDATHMGWKVSPLCSLHYSWPTQPIISTGKISYISDLWSWSWARIGFWDSKQLGTRIGEITFNRKTWKSMLSGSSLPVVAPPLFVFFDLQAGIEPASQVAFPAHFLIVLFWKFVRVHLGFGYRGTRKMIVGTSKGFATRKKRFNPAPSVPGANLFTGSLD